MERTTDKMVRPKLREYLSIMYGGSLVYEELAINKGRTIVDVAIFGRAENIGLEIKSGKDNFSRLKKQIESYDKFFTRNYIVVDDNHLERAEKTVPRYWGILLAYHDGTEVVIELHRDAGVNPKQSKRTVLELLWKDETTTLLKKYGLYKGMSKTRLSRRYTVLNARLNMHEVLDELYNILPQRINWKESSIG
jgi:hypothetical protein